MNTQSLTQQFATRYAAKAVPGLLNAIRNVKWAVRVVFGAGIAISYGHQAHYLTKLSDVGSFGWAIPGVFDVGMLAAMVVTQTIGMKEAAKSRARKVLVALVGASITVNMLAAHSWPVRFVFAVVVALVAAMEWMAAPIGPDFAAIEVHEIEVAATTTPPVDEARRAARRERDRQRRAAKRQAQLTQATQAAAKRETDRIARQARRAEVAAMEAQFAAEAAPVSPAPERGYL